MDSNRLISGYDTFTTVQALGEEFAHDAAPGIDAGLFPSTGVPPTSLVPWPTLPVTGTIADGC